MSSGSPILLKIVSENRFSGKTYFIQLVPVVLLVSVPAHRRRRLLLELGGPQQPPGGELHGDEVPGVRADVNDESEGDVEKSIL